MPYLSTDHFPFNNQHNGEVFYLPMPARIIVYNGLHLPRSVYQRLLLIIPALLAHELSEVWKTFMKALKF